MNRLQKRLNSRTMGLIPAIAGAVVLMMAMAPSANAGIESSAHDFSASGFTEGEICIVCHTPHNADTTVADAPLWNHEVTATATFDMYTSPTFDATAPSQPGGVSKLCLSCHDGSVAIDAYGGGAGTATMSTWSPTSAPRELGTDLSDDHPVSFTFDIALSVTDTGLNNPSTELTALGGTIQADLLFGDTVQCASCHDVHNDAGNSFLLRIPNDGSALCLTCHNK